MNFKKSEKNKCKWGFVVTEPPLPTEGSVNWYNYNGNQIVITSKVAGKHF